MQFRVVRGRVRGELDVSRHVAAFVLARTVAESVERHLGRGSLRVFQTLRWLIVTATGAWGGVLAEYVEKYAKPEELSKAKEAGSDSDSEWSEGEDMESEEENEASHADL